VISSGITNLRLMHVLRISHCLVLLVFDDLLVIVGGILGCYCFAAAQHSKE
jgi:hypothetical protein